MSYSTIAKPAAALAATLALVITPLVVLAQIPAGSGDGSSDTLVETATDVESSASIDNHANEILAQRPRERQVPSDRIDRVPTDDPRRDARIERSQLEEELSALDAARSETQRLQQAYDLLVAQLAEAEEAEEGHISDLPKPMSTQ